MSHHFGPGAVVEGRTLVTITGEPVHIPDPQRLVHLQFRRFAGCPVCNLHLRSMTRRHAEIVAAGVLEVVLFHSTTQDLLPQAGDLPFAVIADPDKRLYKEFGVESSPRSLLDPRAWGAIVRGIGQGLVAMIRERKPAPALFPRGGRYGLPADFLIAAATAVPARATVVARKYGEHADDQWSVDELLALARSGSTAPEPHR